jgi:RHS repeat-associated protein
MTNHCGERTSTSKSIGLRTIYARRQLRAAASAIGVAWFAWTGTALADSLRFEATPESVVLPEGPSGAQGVESSSEVSLATGALALSLPLQLPDGAGGPAPELTLRYNSTSGQGPFGLGWSLPQPRICRSLEAGTPEYGDADQGGDTFELIDVPGGGILTLSESGDWMLRWETGALFRARPDENHGWIVETPDGSIHRFGTDISARISSQPDALFAETACWYLNRVDDIEGRTMLWEWRNDSGMPEINRITWALHTGVPRQLVFLWHAREDLIHDTRWGFPIVSERRVSQIDFSSRDESNFALQSWLFGFESSATAGLLLSQVEIAGSDGASLPVQRFTYADEPTQYSSETLTDDGPGTLDAGRASLVDLNGDSLPDILEARSTEWVWRNNRNGDGWDLPASVSGLDSLPADAQWRVADLDGDGLRDVAVRRGSDVAWYRNESSAIDAAFEYRGSIDFAADIAWNSSDLHLTDLNGDRRADVLTTVGGRTRVTLSAVPRLASGAPDFDAPLRWGANLYPASGSGVDGLANISLADGGVFLVDFDGDGRDDLVRVSGTTGAWNLQVHPAVSAGRFGAAQAISVPPEFVSATRPDSLRIQDISGDGRVDLVSVQGGSLNWVERDPARHFASGVERLTLDGVQGELSLADINADGRVDFLVRSSDSGWRYLRSDVRTSEALLVGWDNGMGGVREFVWNNQLQMRELSERDGLTWRSTVPFPMTLLAEQVERIGQDAEIRTLYRYGNPVWDSRRGRFAGMGWARETRLGDKALNAPTVQHDYVFYTGVGQELSGYDGLVGVESEPLAAENAEVLAGMIRSRSVVGESGSLIRQTLYDPEIRLLSEGRWLQVMAGELQVHAEGLLVAPEPGTVLPENRLTVRGPDPGEDVQYRRTLWQHDEYANEVLTQEMGAVFPSGANYEGDERCTRTDPVVNTVDWLIGPPARIQQLDGDCSEILAEERFLYDGEAFEGLLEGQITRGRQTVHERWLDTEDRWVAVVRREFDARGNRVAELDALGHRREFDWQDEAFLVAERVMLRTGERGNEASVDFLEATMQWNRPRGLVSSVTDFSGSTTALAYDGLGRRVAQINPGDTAALPSITWNWVYGQNGSWLETQTLLDARTGERQFRRQWADPLGRTFAEGVAAESGGWYIESYSDFGITGVVVREYEPFEWEERDAVPRPHADVQFAEMGYDEAAREVFRVFPDGGRVEMLPRAGGMVKRDDLDDSTDALRAETPETTWVDGLDRVTLRRTVRIDSNGVPVLEEERYRRDSLDRLTEIVLADGTPRISGFDSLGRRAFTQDPNIGTTRWFHDDTGTLLTEENELGEQLHYVYDAAGRVVRGETVLADGTASELARYQYDVGIAGFDAGASRGRLTMSEEGGMRTFSRWSPQGQPYVIVREIDSRFYREHTQYDAAQREVARTDATGWTVNTTWDGFGRATGLTGIVESTTFDERGLVRERVFGNGVREALDWDSRRQITQQVISAGEGAILSDLQHRWDTTSLISETIDQTPGLDAAMSLGAQYVYDAARRPVEVTGSFGTLTYEWTAGGSLGSRRLRDPGDVPQATVDTLDLSQIAYGQDGGQTLQRPETDGRRSWQWDAAGRQIAETTAEGTRRLEWTPAGRLSRVTNADGSSEENTWDIGIRRISRTRRDASGDVTERMWFLGEKAELQQTGDDARWFRIFHLQGRALARAEYLGDPGVETLEQVSFESAWRTDLSVSSRSWEVPEVEQSAAFRVTIWWGVPAGLSLFVLVMMARRSRRASLVWVMSVSLVIGPMLPACDDSGRPSVEGESNETTPLPEDVGAILWMHANSLGSVFLVTDSSGNEFARDVATPCGVRTASRMQGDADGLYRYTFHGQQSDEVTGYIDFGARFYDPSVARWLSPDLKPLFAADDSGMDTNLYAYAGYRLMMSIDFLGFTEEVIESSLSQRLSAAAGWAGVVNLALEMPKDVGGTALGVVAVGVAVAETYESRGAVDGATTTTQIASSVYGQSFSGFMVYAAYANPVGAGVAAVDATVGAFAPEYQPTAVVNAGYEMMVLTTHQVLTGGDFGVVDSTLTQMREGNRLVDGVASVGDRIGEAAISLWYGDD